MRDVPRRAPTEGEAPALVRCEAVGRGGGLKGNGDVDEIGHPRAVLGDAHMRAVAAHAHQSPAVAACARVEANFDPVRAQAQPIRRQQRERKALLVTTVVQNRVVWNGAKIEGDATGH